MADRTLLSIDTSHKFKNVNNAQVQPKQQAWVLDGPPSLFVLGRKQEGIHSLIHAADIYTA
jgi:hypothetical protein